MPCVGHKCPAGGLSLVGLLANRKLNNINKNEGLEVGVDFFLFVLSLSLILLLSTEPLTLPLTHRPVEDTLSSRRRQIEPRNSKREEIGECAF